MSDTDKILAKLNSMDDKLSSMEKALRSEIKVTQTEIKAVSEKVDQTWMAVKELRDDKTELNELRKRIEILESKVG
jgi:predicted RNase H-like nuclease (RuvC/YqgF family)